MFERVRIGLGGAHHGDTAAMALALRIGSQTLRMVAGMRAPVRVVNQEEWA